MGKSTRISPSDKKPKRGNGSSCLTTILTLLIFLVLSAALIFHQCSLWKGVSYKLPPAKNLLDDLQAALSSYNGDSATHEYPVGELSFYELSIAVSQHLSDQNDSRQYLFQDFTYLSEDGTTYKINAQLNTGLEVIFERTPDDLN